MNNVIKTIMLTLIGAGCFSTGVYYKVNKFEEQEATKERVSSLKKSLTVDDGEKKPQQSEQLSKKSQDLFDELFGDK